MLIAVAVVGVAMLVMKLWFVVALVFRRRFQFSIRSLLVLTVAVAIPCSWLAVEMKHANQQRETPIHRVRITKPFYLGAYPVTQDEYQAVMGTTPSRFTGDGRRPVENVSWDDAVEFCKRLSAKEGKEYRLPTEAEREYACRAATTVKWCFGDDEEQLGDYAWYDKNSGRMTHAVGEKKPNAWGLYDMHGNVWELCADCYDDGYYAKSPTDDPTGPATCSGRVVRGGAWGYPAACCRSANRGDDWPWYRMNDRGFRVALVPADK